MTKTMRNCKKVDMNVDNIIPFGSSFKMCKVHNDFQYI